eukprot:Tbor_TRINITY_DN5093_c1_g3::TRINITY_DN5093_c1_g3_i1::g.14086::m.14086
MSEDECDMIYVPKGSRETTKLKVMVSSGNQGQVDYISSNFRTVAENTALRGGINSAEAVESMESQHELQHALLDDTDYPTNIALEQFYARRAARELAHSTNANKYSRCSFVWER